MKVKTKEMINKLSLLKDSLEVLSKPYKEQLKCFPDFVDVYDEVISDFDNAFRLLPDLMEESVISYEAVREILKCNNLIELNLCIEKRRTDESFEFDETWNSVREYAANAVSLLNNEILDK